MEEKNLGRKRLSHTLKSGSEHIQTPPEVFLVSGRQLDFGNEGLIGDSYLVPDGQERAAAKRRFGVTMDTAALGSSMILSSSSLTG